MRTCKVKGCDRKHYGKGYCNKHYQRKKLGQPLIKKCKDCGKNIEQFLWYFFCKRCKERKDKKRYSEYGKKVYDEWKGDYIKRNYVNIPRLTGIKGTQGRVFTDGVTEEIKPLIPMIKNKVLNDCIKHPAKYLYGKKKK